MSLQLTSSVDAGEGAVELIKEVELLGEEPTIANVWNLLKFNTIGVKSKLQEHENKLVAVDQRIDVLHEKIKQLESAAVDASYESELTKQRNLRNNVTLMGIPHKQNENLKAIATAVFHCIGIEIRQSKIRHAYRKGSMVFVCLHEYDDKANIIKSRTNQKIMADMIGIQYADQSSTQVFINNHTTPYFGRILQFGRNATRDKRISSIRLSTRGCLVQLEPNGEEILVKSVSHFVDIMKIRSTSTASTASATIHSINETASQNQTPRSNTNISNTKHNNKTKPDDNQNKTKKRNKKPNGNKRRDRSFDLDKSSENGNPTRKHKPAGIECEQMEEN